MKTSETLAREAFLNSCYGKFDWVEDIIPQELLLRGRPRRIKEWLIKNLRLNETDINDNTLRSWLHRYRKTRKKFMNEQLHQWQKFNPSPFNPESDKGKLLIKKVAT